MGVRCSNTLYQEHHMSTPTDSYRSTTADDQASDRAVDIVALYHQVAAHAPLPIAMTVGRAHRLCGANPAFCQLLGAVPRALGRQSLVDAVPAADTDRVRALLDRVYHTGEAGLDGDPPPIDAARDQVYWTYSVWPILDAHGRPAGLVLLIRA